MVNNSLGVAILYHQSSDDAIGEWEYSLSQNPTKFEKIPDDIGWPKNEELPEVCFVSFT